MSYKQLKEFKDELISLFDLNKDSLRCYKLDDNHQIKVMLFGKQEWNTCFIGLLINHNFYIIGSCINEDYKSLYVSLKCSLPQNEHKLKEYPQMLFDEEEQKNIINQLKHIFPKQ